MSKVSIIIPVYNAEKYLKHSLQCICAQTFEDWELLLVDDKSTDGSLRICQELAQTDSRVKVLQTTHVGAGPARQKGLDAASGEFIYFPDADDWTEPGLLSDAVSRAEASGADVVLFGYWLEYPEKGKAPERRACSFQGVFSKAQLLGELLLPYYTTRPATLWTRLFRRSYLEKTGCRFRPFPRGEDQMFIFESEMAQDYVVEIMDQPYYHYIRRAGSLVEHYVSDDSTAIGLQIADAYERVLAQSDNKKAVEQLICKTYAEIFLHKFINVTSPTSPLSRQEQKAVIRELLNHPSMAESLRKVSLRTVEGGKYGKATLWLMGRGLVNAAFALKRFW